jgi:hypothetical protein
VGDKGLGGGLEIGWTSRLVLPAQLDEGIGQIFLFRDHAQTEKLTNAGIVSSTEKISSRGIGLRWQSVSGARTTLYVAKPDDRDGIPQIATQKLYVNFAMPW